MFAILPNTEPVARGIPDSVRYAHTMQCYDTATMLDFFDEKAGSFIMEVGCQDESADASAMMAEAGFRVIGIDLREPVHPAVGNSFEFVRGDFCDLPPHFIKKHIGKVDAIVSISAIEHFGLGAYGEKYPNYTYDIVACRQIWQLLKEEGTFYITVPFGKQGVDVRPHWRVYSWQTLNERVVQDFSIDKIAFFVSCTPCRLNGRIRTMGETLTFEEAQQFEDYTCPHCTVFMKLKKRKKMRIAPNGR